MKQKTYTKKLNLRLTDKVYEDLQKLSDEAGISMADILRKLVNKELYGGK